MWGGPRLCYVKRPAAGEVAVRRCVTNRVGPRVPDNDSVKRRPMLVASGPLRPDDDRYAFEVKWDDFRALIIGALKYLEWSPAGGLRHAGLSE